jgi:hypothetical protein
MAVPATIGEFAFVRIVFYMAIDALTFRSCKNLRRMTGVALEIVVFSKKREAGQVVGEKRRFLPAICAMAVVALIALFAGMGFVFQVAGCTGSARRCFINRLDVAIIAGNRFMRSA